MSEDCIGRGEMLPYGMGSFVGSETISYRTGQDVHIADPIRLDPECVRDHRTSARRNISSLPTLAKIMRDSMIPDFNGVTEDDCARIKRNGEEFLRFAENRGNGADGPGHFAAF